MRLATSSAAVSPTWRASSRTSSEAGAIAAVLRVARPPAVLAAAQLAADRGQLDLEARDGLADEMRRRVATGALAQLAYHHLESVGAVLERGRRDRCGDHAMGKGHGATCFARARA